MYMNTARKGFTLVELLVVVSIIGILSVIGLTLYSGVKARARDAQRLDDARKIMIALEAYKSGAGKYPNARTLGDPNYDSRCQVCTSRQGDNWLRELGSGDFINNTYPKDPINTYIPNLTYYYGVTDSGDDYCLQIGMETNASSSPYYAQDYVQGTSKLWILKFGPKGSKAGYCASFAVWQG